MKGLFRPSFFGNLFYLEKHVDSSVIMKSVFLTLAIGAISFLFEGTPFNLPINLKHFFYGFLGLSLFYLVLNYKVLTLNFKKYFKSNALVSGGVFLEIIIAGSIVWISNGQLFAWVLGTLWLFSGILRVLIQFTPALFHSEIKNFLKVIQIFAYFRASYFSVLGIIIITSLPKSTIPLLSLLLLGTFFWNIWMISNLNPYMIKHSSVKEAISMMRDIEKNKSIKISSLKSEINLSELEFNRLLTMWKDQHIIEIDNKTIKLSEEMRRLSNE